MRIFGSGNHTFEVYSNLMLGSGPITLHEARANEKGVVLLPQGSIFAIVRQPREVAQPAAVTVHSFLDHVNSQEAQNAIVADRTGKLRRGVVPPISKSIL